REFVEDQEISAGRYFDVATEPNGVFWLATSDGLFRHAPPAWRTPRALAQINARVHAIWEDRDQRLWLASASALHCLQENQLRTFPYPENFEKYFLASDKLLPISGDKLVMNADGRLLQF